MTNEIRTQKAGFSLVPKDMNEAIQFAKLMAESDLVPSNYKGKPANIVIAVQMGLEIGLSPMQAIQSIAVINGKPCIYGDGMLALVQSHQQYEWHTEKSEAGKWAEMTIKRKGAEPYTIRFTKEMAQTAGLWGKAGPWTQYPDRMLQMRARAWACRDQFSDALKGIMPAEEVQDYKINAVNAQADYKEPKAIEVKPEPKESKPVESIVENAAHVIEAAIVEVKKAKRPDDTVYYKVITVDEKAYLTNDIEAAKIAKAIKESGAIASITYTSSPGGSINLLEKIEPAQYPEPPIEHTTVIEPSKQETQPNLI